MVFGEFYVLMQYYGHILIVFRVDFVLTEHLYTRPLRLFIGGTRLNSAQFHLIELDYF